MTTTTPLQETLAKFRLPFHADIHGEIFDSSDNILSTCYGVDSDSEEDSAIIGTAIADFLNRASQPEKPRDVYSSGASRSSVYKNGVWLCDARNYSHAEVMIDELNRLAGGQL